MPPQILSTKLYIPQPRQNLVSRPRLLDLLKRGTKNKLTLISAPAGYGKTTLLSEWINQSEIPSCWLSLDTQENDLKLFLAYLIASLQSIHIEVDERIASILQTQQPEKYDELLIPLINQISDADSRFTLVLDDYHLIHNDKIHKTLTFFLDHLPTNMHLVVISRADPPIRLAQLRARGDLCEIRVADLRFNIDEAVEFLNRGMGVDLPLSDVTLLTDKTEGWIAGLQLAALSLQKHPDRHAFVTAFAGDDRYIADYLLDEVLRRQPPHIQTFLLQISLLDQFCAPLCDAVTKRNDSRVILEELERANLFLVSLDHQRKWFRYHQLFAELLRNRLKHEYRDSIAELYRRASSWHERQQMLSEAVRLALLGNDTENVAKMMEGHLLAIVSTSELTILNRLLASLSADAICGNPWLALAKAWGMAYVWQFDSAETYLEKAASNLEGFDEITQKRLKGRILVLQSYIAGSRRDYPKSIRTAQYALNHIPYNDLSMRSFSLLIIGNAHRFEGNLADAIAFHHEALSLSEEAGDVILSVMILSRITDMYITMGQLNRAHMTGMQAFEMINNDQSQTGSQSFILGYLKLRLSGLYYERNDLDRALQCVEVGFDLVKAWGAYDSISLGYINFAKIYRALGDYDLASNYLKVFKEIYPWVNRLQYRFASAHETEIHLRVGNHKEVDYWSGSCGVNLSDCIQFLDFLFYDVLAQVLIARGQLDDAKALLERLLVLSEKTGAVQYKIRTLGRKSLVFHKMGDADEAITTLESALALAAPEGYLRSFIDQGDDMAELVYQASTQGIYPGFCKQILDGFPVISAFEKASKGLVESLSSREVEVLSHIAEGFTNQEIAQELVLSLHTVKTHARNIYSKLGVKNRTEAVSKARLLGLLT
jgi:LuxR family maltose regulon positive regulatory protein